MRTITAKFKSTCAASGQVIKKGETIIYCPITKKAYKPDHAPRETNSEEIDGAAGAVQAQEEAYFDNFCQRNNI